MKLCNAGFRERAYAEQLIQEEKVPKEISLEKLLIHGEYDPSRDEIILKIEGKFNNTKKMFPITFRWKVMRP